LAVAVTSIVFHLVDLVAIPIASGKGDVIVSALWGLIVSTSSGLDGGCHCVWSLELLVLLQAL
jgi:hypothetical protein